jgi:hypothetical protein
VSLGQLHNCIQVPACVFIDTHWHQKHLCKLNTMLAKGWRIMEGICHGRRSSRGIKSPQGACGNEQEEQTPALMPWFPT